MRKRQRRLRNFLLDPSRQLRSAGYFVGLYLAYSAFLSAVFLHVTFEQHRFVMDYLGQGEEASFFDMFQNPIIVSGLLEVAVVFLFFLAIAMTLTVVFSHRVFGPLIPIKRQLEAMRSGDYSRRIVLRRHDELRDVAEAINQLTAQLEKAACQEPEDLPKAIRQLNARLEERQVQRI